MRGSSCGLGLKAFPALCASQMNGKKKERRQLCGGWVLGMLLQFQVKTRYLIFPLGCKAIPKYSSALTTFQVGMNGSAHSHPLVFEVLISKHFTLKMKSPALLDEPHNKPSSFSSALGGAAKADGGEKLGRTLAALEFATCTVTLNGSGVLPAGVLLQGFRMTNSSIILCKVYTRLPFNRQEGTTPGNKTQRNTAGRLDALAPSPFL